MRWNREVWMAPQGSHIHASSTGLRYRTLALLDHVVMTGLDEAQVRRAVGALLKHIKSSAAGKPSLLDDEGEVVLAQLSLHKIPGNVKAKPISIAIPHPLRRREDCDMCLFVKDNAKAWVKEMLENEPVEGLTKVRSREVR